MEPVQKEQTQKLRDELKTALDNNDYDTLRQRISELEQAAAYMSSQGAAPQGDAAPGSNPDDVVDADFTDKKD